MSLRLAMLTLTTKAPGVKQLIQFYGSTKYVLDTLILQSFSYDQS